MDFVERLKQYAVDYAVDQDRTEILALQSREQDAVGTLEQIARTFDLALESAREKEQSGDGAAHSLRRDTFGLSKNEFAQFYDKIAEIKIEKNPQFQNAPDGSYIFDIENKLVYTDGDWDNPTIRRVVSFDLKNGTLLHDAKSFFTELETDGADYDEIKGLLAYVYGKEVVSLRHQDVRDAAEGQDWGGTRKDAGRTGRDTRTDLPSAGERKYALKKSVEQIEDLVAVHNTTADKLKKTLDLGGFPMPSIAVTCCEKCFSEWRGDICRRKKSDNIARVLGIQFPDKTSNDHSSADIIADLTRAVKGENAENQAEDAQDTANSEQTQAETPEFEPNQENGEQKFSLKSESANKVDVDQTLRAGDNSMAEQTETNEQTRHEPVPVTDKMRQWADKRAGQIIREYRSAIDGASVREDMAKLVNELAENGASSDALNATVNMAKGIIEKRYGRKYDDVCANAHIPIHVPQGNDSRSTPTA